MLLIGCYLATIQLAIVAGSAQGTFRGILLTSLALTYAYTLSRVGQHVSEAITQNKYLDRQIIPIVQNVWTFGISLATLQFVLSILNIHVTPLLASAGVLGIVVGLAARDTITNFFGSLALSADGTYALGDYVVLDDGTRGRVQDISISSTVICTLDDILVTVRNSQLNNTAPTNESAPRSHRRLKIPVGVAYDTDIDELERVLTDIAEGKTVSGSSHRAGYDCARSMTSPSR